MLLKYKISFLLIFLSILHVNAQNIGINSTGSAPNSSSILDVSSTNKGILIPRVSLVSTVDVVTIASPATNLMVFNTNAAMTNGNGTGFYFYNGSKWVNVISPSNGPGTNGQVVTSQGAGNQPQWAAASSSGGVNFVPGTVVYGPTASPTKDVPTILNLFGVIGAAERVVMLKVYNNSNGSQTIRFKKLGEALSVKGTSGGTNTITLPVNTMGYVIVKTNTSGLVSWETSASFGSKITTIYVEAYW